MIAVLGLDPSLRNTGVALPDGALVTWSPTSTGVERLEWFARMLDRVFAAHAVDLIVIEGAALGGPMQNNASSIGELHGVLKLTAFRADKKPVALVPPSCLKKFATGRGNAKKPDMRMELFKRTQLDIADDNQVDAYWLRAMGMEWAGDPIVDNMPKAHRAALDSVKWPRVARPDTDDVETRVDVLKPVAGPDPYVRG